MKSSKSSLFLLELIIAILFFSIASAACIQLFAKAHTLDIKTGEQNQTIIWSQNLAELWRAGNGDLSFVEKQLKTDYLFPEDSVALNSVSDTASADAASHTLTLSFDKNWNFTDHNVSYYIVLKTDKGPDENALLNASISFFRIGENNTPFYQLPLLLHITDKEDNRYE